jgi:hypothetical protein
MMKNIVCIKQANLKLALQVGFFMRGFKKFKNITIKKRGSGKTWTLPVFVIFCPNIEILFTCNRCISNI